MRPLKLTLAAFGPFPDQEVIDFTQLGHAPFFLINGPTGSGKSTLLDAICYGLYGSTTGNERTGDQMRSDRAAESTVTYVDFEFELGNKRFRIERKPEQWLPKQRGTGVTRHSHSACLEQWQSKGWLTLAAKPNQVNTMIEELIGLSADQFRQVMVIPQGKFRDLLLASSKDREQIFGQLFSTDVYRQLENTLAEKASGIRKEKESYDQQLKGILDLVDAANESELVQSCHQLEPIVKQRMAEYDTLTTTLDKAKQEHQHRIYVAGRFALRDTLLQQIQAHASQTTAVDELRKRRDRALQAQKIAHINQAQIDSEHKLITWKRRVQDLAQQQSVVTRQLEQAKDVFQAASKALEIKPKLQQACFELEQQAVRIDEIESLQQRLDNVIQEQNRIDRDIEKQEETQRRYQAKLDELEQQSILASEAQQKLTVVRLELDKLLAVKKRWQKVRSYQQQQVKLNLQLTEARQARQAQRMVEQQASVAALTLEAHWLLNQAADIAKTLTDDHACPVCGSVDHPNPAQFSGDVVTKPAVDSARLVARDAALKLKDIENTLESLNQERVRLNQDLASMEAEIASEWSGSEQALDRQCEQLNQQISDYSQLDLPTILQRLEKGKSMVEQGVEWRKTLDKQRESNHLTMAGYRAQLDTLHRASPHEISREKIHSELNSVKQKIIQLESAGEKAQQDVSQLETQLTVVKTQLTTAEGESSQWQTQHDSDKAIWHQALTHSQFDDQHAYQDAYKSNEDIESLSADIKHFDDLQAKLISQLEPLTLELSDQTVPNLIESEQNIVSINQLVVSCHQALSEHKSRYDALRQANARLELLKEKNRRLEEEYKVLGTLSDVANGKNHLRISLHRFVLGVLLDDVLIQASVRLEAMSCGRYRLIRKNERSKGNASSGLDLLVEDSYTSKARDVATLSGGESFIAALALALALSDVVQAHSGGVRLDTLFIDEGFGSLDTESLDLAMQTLIDLQKGGRTIGIISHVSELKEQIACRIDIQHSQHGSKISLVS
jgi:exonuclease SbcC